MMMMMMTQLAAKPHKRFPELLETVPLRLDSKTLLPSVRLSSLANDSISPWSYKWGLSFRMFLVSTIKTRVYNQRLQMFPASVRSISRDDSMFPNALSEAHCLLHGCLGLDGLEDSNLRSRPIMHQVLVLRRVRAAEAGHDYHYRLESKLISVGCTCVRQKVVVQQWTRGVCSSQVAARWADVRVRG